MVQRWRDWVEGQGWRAFPFQERTWDAYERGHSGLLHAPTGMGKTVAAWGGPIREWCREQEHAETAVSRGAAPLRVLWITPLRALANDIVTNLERPIDDLGLPWRIELRTGDSTTSQRRRQRDRLPTALVTTPESLTLLLSYEGARARFESLRCVVVDEWHELMGTKRGVQTELGLARLRVLAPQMRTWGLSATLGNTDEAMSVLLGPRDAGDGRLIAGAAEKVIEVKTLMPDDAERFPWAGHLGLRLVGDVVSAIEAARSTLVFTNTRSQTEAWFRAIHERRPDWIGAIAIHHGSLDRDVRSEVETLLRQGRLRAVVCTSSLDLGVDFTPVDQVIQIGSPKGIARMLQRAGRSGHQPGVASRILGVPTNALELVEFSAARAAVEKQQVERRDPVDRPLDVLAQHLVTIAAGDGFDEVALRDEVRSTHAYADLDDDAWRWCMEFVTRGGPTLEVYPQYQKVERVGEGYRVTAPAIARLHRMSIGTITSEGAMQVRFVRGRSLGTIEESFISWLKPGSRFVFAGRVLELVRVRDMTAYVRRATSKRGTVPRWAGGKSPLSTQLAAAVRRRLDEARRGTYVDDEMRRVRPLLELQARWSVIPGLEECLIETIEHRGAHHSFVFTLAGRLVNEGLSALLAHRITRERPTSVSATGNDYGIELMTDRAVAHDETRWRALLSSELLIEDLLACVGASELPRRHFRQIARVAGLIFAGFPGQPKPSRHLQASSDLFFDVFTDFDPSNMLLDQARREVLDRELEVRRLRSTLERIGQQRLVMVPIERFTPLAFPLFVERLRSQHVSTEGWRDRVQRMIVQLEKAADGTTAVWPA